MQGGDDIAKGKANHVRGRFCMSQCIHKMVVILCLLHSVLFCGCSFSTEDWVEQLADSDPNTRVIAVSELGKSEDPKAIPPLANTLLNDESGYIRKTAAEALGNLGYPEAIEPLIRALQDEFEYVRKAAVMALGKIGDRRCVIPLTGALQDPFDEVRNEAAYSLGNIKDVRAVPSLISALRDEDEWTRNSAVKALVDGGRTKGIH
jgi:HEAT repeat protein